MSKKDENNEQATGTVPEKAPEPAKKEKIGDLVLCLACL